MFKRATGALVISKAIEERARERAMQVNPDLMIHRVPSVVDVNRFAAASSMAAPPIMGGQDQPVPNFVYCGTWLNDVFFLIRAFALVKLKSYRCKLTIVGNSDDHRDRLLEYAIQQGLSAEDVVITGCVDERTLEACYKSASALLMPLWNDDQSVTRLPNKLGEYLASGRPVISCKIGDLMDFLADNVSAYLGEPGHERDFVDRMTAVLQDPERAAEVGRAGQQAGFAFLDYKTYSSGLSEFFAGCIGRHNQRRSTRSNTGQLPRSYMVLRNCLCGLLSLVLIVSGGVRRARKRALGGGVVTAIYFHKPNKRLFVRCVRWLIKHGYTFISANDLLDILYRGKTPPRGAAWLSFDDGNKELLDEILPLVRLYRIPVTLFIPTGIIEGDGLFPWLHKGTPANSNGASAPVANGLREALSVAELKQVLYCPQVNLGSHTVNHAITTGLTEDKARLELGESKHTLESWACASVTCFAYPEGRFDGLERPFLKKFGYLLAATTENAFITPDADPYLVPRFSIGDDISFPEAICNMVGVWRPAIDPLIKFRPRLGRMPSGETSRTEPAHESPQSV
jgi:peptidoglycan/xylan/chitin deacetylase (PgdA/CDA1 family)